MSLEINFLMNLFNYILLFTNLFTNEQFTTTPQHMTAIYMEVPQLDCTFFV